MGNVPKSRTLGQIIREVSLKKEVSLELLYDLSYLTIDLRDKRDELFYTLMKDMFDDNVLVDIRPLDQRFKHFEYEHVARIIAIVFHPQNRGKLIQGLIDLCKGYQREMELLTKAKASFIRPYVIGRPGKLSGPRRRYDTIQELLDVVAETNKHPVHEDVLRAVNEKSYDGDVKDGIVVLSCLANRYKTEMHNMFTICTEYLNECPDDLSPDEIERVDTYRHSIETNRPTDEIAADNIWESGVTHCSDKVLLSLATVCNRYKSSVDDLSQLYVSKRQLRDGVRISQMLSKDTK